MSVARKFNKANAATTGFEIHNGLMNEETLLHIVQDSSFADLISKYRNEKMRVFRDNYREFELKSKKYQSNGKDEKLQELVTNWLKESLSYLGYSDFKEDSIKLNDDKGHVPVLRAPTEAHSVAIFLCNDIKCQSQAFETGYLLTTISGETQIDPQIKKSWTLCEQVEKSMKQAGISEALLFLPYYIYYFRSDAQLSEQCLEINISDLMRADNDEALVLATHLLNESFFRFQLSAVTDEGTEAEESDKDDDESEEESEAAGATQTKVTPSSNLFKEDLELARQITEELHKQVTLALELLANERLEVDPELKSASQQKSKNAQVSQELFEDGLFILYRTLFVLYAEAKRFLPIENKQYASFYSMDHLIDWAEDYLVREKRGIADHEGTYLWGALKALFTLLRRGIQLEGDMLVSPYNGQLFSPDHAKTYDNGPLLRDAAVARVLIALTKVGGDEIGRRWHFGNLGIEQLGAVYEAMLTQKPMVLTEPHEWVPAHGGGVGLVSRSFADAMELERFQKEEEGARTKRRGKSSKAKGSKNDLDTFIPKNRPAFTPTKGKFVLATMGGKKRQTASFYTPPKLAQFLVKRTLRPLVEGKTVDEILNVRLIEPAVGSGGFLIAAVRYMAEHLLKAKQCENHIDIRGLDKFTLKDIQKCKRQICEKCLYGVDINPLSVELTRTSLYLECLVEGEPLPFLHHHLKAGNSLIWAEFQGRAQTSWDKDSKEKFPTLFDIPVDHLKLDKKILEAWDDMKRAYGEKENSDEIQNEFKEKIASLKSERKTIKENNWANFAKECQTKVNKLLELVKDAHLDFEKIQNNPNVVDQLDERHKDRLSMIPDMDTVLIDSYGVDIDHKLELKRKKALINEYGTKQYDSLVRNQRSFMRLKALGDLNTALWFWPIDKYKDFPTYGVYKELCLWLLDETTLDRNVKNKKSLTKNAFKALAVATKTSKLHQFFHWQVEYAHVFLTSGGFSALVANPPWKVVGVKGKDVYPNNDPQFLKSKSSKKAERISYLYKQIPHLAKDWYNTNAFTNDASIFYKNSGLTSIQPEGKIDLAVMFTLLSEKILCLSGMKGLIVSRSSIFLNKATRNLREHFFNSWGLENATTLINVLNIFDIDSRIEFSTIVGNNDGKLSSPRMINGVIDPNDLEQVDLAFHASTKNSSFKVVNLSFEDVSMFFGKETLSIPSLTNPLQLQIVKSLHKASGDVCYLPDLENGFINYEINQNRGQKKGLSVLGTSLPKKEIPTKETILNNEKCDYVPVYRGRQFNMFNPFIMDENVGFNFNQYAIRQKFKEGVNLEMPTIAWRAMSQSGNQRTLVTSLLPPNTWCDNNVWTIQHSNYYQTLAHLCILSSLASDFLIKLVVSTSVPPVVLAQLPIPMYDSKALHEAVKLAGGLLLIFPDKKLKHFLKSIDVVKPILDEKQRDQIQARIDVLIWLHFGMNKGVLNKENLLWLIETQFRTLNSKKPDYIKYVSIAYDEYTQNRDFTSGAMKNVFKKQTNQDKAA